MASSIADQVASELHNELHCVSIGSISLDYGVSRREASEILNNMNDKEYKATYCVQTEEMVEDIPCTVFRLETLSQKKQDANALLYALTVEDETLETGHERHMAKLRDCIKDNNVQNIISSVHRDAIAPSEVAQTALDESQAVAEAEPEEENAATTSAPKAVTKKKSVSAASFFKKSSEEKENKMEAAEPTKKAAPPKKKPEKPVAKKPVGDADDFIGDVDDEEDDDEDPMEVDEPESKPKKRSLEDKPTKKASSPATKKPSSPIKGAMDDFAKTVPATKPSSPAEKKKRRRKVLKQRTTADENGYLHTETVEEWEDIPSDEEEAKAAELPSVPKPAASKAAPKAKKQQNLMGFFAKK